MREREIKTQNEKERERVILKLTPMYIYNINKTVEILNFFKRVKEKVGYIEKEI